MNKAYRWFFVGVLTSGGSWLVNVFITFVVTIHFDEKLNKMVSVPWFSKLWITGIWCFVVLVVGLILFIVDSKNEN